jgi:hypothetical protein
MKMNKEKLMQLLSEAIDKGSYVSIHMSQFDQSEGKFAPVNQETANDYINRFQEAFGIDKEVTHDTNGHSHSYSFSTGEYYVACSYVPNKQTEYLQEDVDLSGMEDGEEYAS